MTTQIIKQDRILVVDIEATCWEKKRPEGIPNEIIEVGICTLFTKGRRIEGKQGIMVRPDKSYVSPFCTQLTSITPEMVVDAAHFSAACDQLKSDYESQSVLWASWGNYDRTIFHQQCAAMGVDYPFSAWHVNLKALYASKLNDGKQIGMAGALRQTGLGMEGNHHRGVDDAYNIARLAAYMMDSLEDDIVFEAAGIVTQS